MRPDILMAWQHIRPNGRRRTYKLIKTPLHDSMLYLHSLLRGEFAGYNWCCSDRSRIDLVEVYNLSQLKVCTVSIPESQKREREKKKSCNNLHLWSKLLSASAWFWTTSLTPRLLFKQEKAFCHRQIGNVNIASMLCIDPSLMEMLCRENVNL